MKILAVLIMFLALSYSVLGFDPNDPFKPVKTEEKEEIKPNITIIKIQANDTTLAESWRSLQKVDKAFIIGICLFGIISIGAIIYLTCLISKLKKQVKKK